MNDFIAAEQIDIENRAGICRVTAGWKKPELALEKVRPYWRDAHSPTIARRDGIWEYRHYPLDPVCADLVPAIGGLDRAPPVDQQLMWLSDVRYRDADALAAFGLSPPPPIRAQILGDIDMIVDRSTTYIVMGENGVTLADNTGDPAPQGPSPWSSFALFLRRRGGEAAFRQAVRALGASLAGSFEVRRVRLSLFDVPDMEAERRSGYPIKTHEVSQQYQAWIDVVVEHDLALPAVLAAYGSGLADEILALHAYPSPAVYTFNYGGRPTLTGLRGYAAHKAIQDLRATHQTAPELLTWLYGPIADAPPLA